MGSSRTIAPAPKRRADGKEAAPRRATTKKADPRLESELSELLDKYADPHEERPIHQISPAEVEQLRRLWKKLIAGWPAFPRRRFLRHHLGLIALGADGRKRLEAQLARLIHANAMRSPSAAWHDAWGELGEDLPRQPGSADDSRVRMKRRRAVRDANGQVIRPAGRWMPPQSFELESHLDEITTRELLSLPILVSASAEVIQRIEQSRGHEVGWAGREAIVGISTIEGR